MTKTDKRTSHANANFTGTIMTDGFGSTQIYIKHL